MTTWEILLIAVSLAMVGVVIGLVTGTLALAGIQLGNRLRGWLSWRLDIVGGLILVGLGVRILFQH